MLDNRPNVKARHPEPVGLVQQVAIVVNGELQIATVEFPSLLK